MCKHECFGFGLFCGFFSFFYFSVNRALSSITMLIFPCNTPSLVEAAHVDQISLYLSDKERVEDNFLLCFLA